MKYLYKNFLNDRKVYSLNVNHWKDMIVKKVLGKDSSDQKTFKEWLTVRFSGNKNFYDGNPIFNAIFVTKNKAVRIIQEAPESDTVSIGAWIDAAEQENGKSAIPELVISLELTRESRSIALDLIKGWIVNNLDREMMQYFIDSKTDKLQKFNFHDSLPDLQAA